MARAVPPVVNERNDQITDHRTRDGTQTAQVPRAQLRKPAIPCQAGDQHDSPLSRVQQQGASNPSRHVRPAASTHQQLDRDHSHRNAEHYQCRFQKQLLLWSAIARYLSGTSGMTSLAHFT